VSENGRPEKSRQYPANRVRTPYYLVKPLRRPVRRRGRLFGAFYREIVGRYKLTDPQALRDVYELAQLYVEMRLEGEDLARARQQEDVGLVPKPAVRTLQKRLARERRDYHVALEALEARWGGGRHGRAAEPGADLLERLRSAPVLTPPSEDDA